MIFHRPFLPWAIALWLSLSLLGSVWLVRSEQQRLREAFETDARIVHRLLSQRAVQHEAILATLALLQPAEERSGVGAEERLPALYPQILKVERRHGDAMWPAPFAKALSAAESQSRQSGQAALGGVDFAAGNFWLVLATQPVSYALQVDLRAMIPQAEWPLPAQGSPVGLSLVRGADRYTIEAGLPAAPGVFHTRFEFHKKIAALSQPFEVVAWREFGWQAFPWWRMVAWSLALAAMLAFASWLLAQRRKRQRAEELVRLAQIARLNTLGEMAAGLAHELNQPLAAVSANAQAARRMLDDEPADVPAARSAMVQAVAQAKRAAEVLARLRRAIERPGVEERLAAVGLHEAAHKVLDLLDPESRRRGVSVVLAGDEAVIVNADPVALEQIIHNLLMNALHALEGVVEGERNLQLSISREADKGCLRVLDSGPGIPPESLPRLFEPFFTTKADGLGLGLSLCETLATSMGGRLQVANAPVRGAEFSLFLPLVEAA